MPPRHLLCFAFATLILSAPAWADAPYAPAEVIVKYRPAAAGSRRASIQADLHASVARRFETIGAEVLTLADSVTVESAIAALRADPDVEFAEPNYRLYPSLAPDDSLFSQQWAMRNTGQTGGVAGVDIHATRAWDLFTGDPELKIGVIDSGVDYTHPDLVDNIWTNPGEIPGNGIDDDGNGYVDDIHGYDFANNDPDPMDDLGHGTHVAGTIAARGNNRAGVTGVCWRAKIVCIKFLGPGGGFVSGAIASIEYAIAMGVKLTNNSWGGPTASQALREAIDAAGTAGQLFVAAAGNSGANDDLSPTFPSAYDLPNIVSVAATNSSDQLSTFSNYGATSVDLGAPGEGILSTLYGGGYVLASGTSMAAPHVTGALALQWGRHPELTAAQLKARLLSSVDPIPALAGRTVSGGRLNALFAAGDADAVPPAAVADLTVSQPTSNSLTLGWHAPGDDGNTGTAEKYELRYSTAPLDAGNFSAGHEVVAPAPLPAGQAQTIEVGGLTYGTSYYFAVRAFDEVANAGALSNVATGTTLGAPHATVEPGSLTASLPSGGRTTRSLALQNDGEGTLDFTIESASLAAMSATAPVHAAAAFAKGQANPLAALPALATHGGPDGFGYRWNDSGDPDGPVYSWVEISADGTPVALAGDDEISDPIPIGFSFRFYDGIFNSLRVCTNGWVSFTSSANSFYYQALPNPGAPENLLAPFWTDLVLVPQSVFVRREPGRTILEFLNAHTYDGGGPFTFELMLFTDGRVVFQYRTMPASARFATVGFQNALRDDGLTIAFNANYVHDGLAVGIAPPRTWLSVAPRSGRILAGQGTSIEVGIDATGQFGGTYDDVLRITSNDPLNPELPVPVHLDVTGVPNLGIDRSSLAFGPLVPGNSASASMTVSNLGTQPLVVAGIDASNPEVTVAPASFTVGVFDSRRVVATYRPLTVGSPGQLTVRSNDPDEPSRVIALTGFAAAAPVMVVSTAPLAVTLLSGATKTLPLHVSNTGEGTLYFRARVSAAATAWASVSPDTGQVTAQQSVDLQVRFDAADRLGGVYDATLGLTTNDPAQQGPPGIPVRMTVTGIPDLLLSRSSMNFGSVHVTESKMDSLQLVNLGTGPLTVTRVATSGADFVAEAAAFSLLPGESRMLRVSFVPSVEGQAPGTLTISSDDPDMAENVVALDGLGLPGPDLTVAPDSLYAELAPDQVLSRDVTLSNDSARDVAWNATVSIGFDASPPPTAVAAGWFTNAARQDGTGLAAPEGPSGHADAIQAMLAAMGSSHIVLSEDAEQGPNGWTAQGDPLWHITARAYNSPAHSWWCGFETSSTYSNGAWIRAALVSPPIDLRLWGAPATVSFVENYVTEPGWDECRVEASTDDGATWQGLRGGAWGSSNGWKLTLVDLSALVGRVIRIRFQFDTHDGFANAFPGWFLDDIVVTTSSRQWVDLSPKTGSLAVGASTLLHPVFDTTVMTGGLYTGSVRFEGDDPSRAPLQMPVELRVVGVPNLALSSASAVLPDEFVGATLTDTTLRVSNTGTDWLDISHLEITPGPFSTSLDAFRVPPGGGRAIPLTFSPATVGDAAAVLSIRCNDPDQPLVSVDVRGTAQTPPALALAPESLYVEVGSTMTATRTVVLTNTGGSTLFWSASIMPAAGQSALPTWLTVAPGTGSVGPGGAVNLSVGVAPQSAIPGSFPGVVRLVTNDPARHEADLPVEMFVPANAHLAVNPGSLEFGVVQLGQPKSMVVEMSSVGSTAVVVEAVATSPGPFTVGATPGRLDPGTSVPVVVSFTALEPGDVLRTLNIVSSDPVRREIKIPLHAIVASPPRLTMSPESFDVIQESGLRETHALSLGNTGGQALHYQVTLYSNDPSAIASPPAQSGVRATGPHPLSAGGGPGPRAVGGPDHFGHQWIDSDEPGGPLYQWIELVGSGTPIALSGDDVISGALPIGFEFPYYGSVFTQFRVCSNGWLSFTSTSRSFAALPLPSIGAPENLLAVYWADLVAPVGSTYYRQEPGRLIVEFTGLTVGGQTGPCAFEAILESGGRVTFQYRLVSHSVANAVIGIQDADRTDGLTIASGGNIAHDGFAVRIDAPAPWVTVGPLAGTIAPGEHSDVAITFDSIMRQQGNYAGHLLLVTDDPLRSLTLVPLGFTVHSVPDIAIGALELGDVLVGGSVSGQVLVSNEGTRPLDVFGVELNGTGFEIVNPSFPFSIAPGASAALVIRFTAEEPCDPCTGFLDVYSNDPDENPISIEIHSRALTPPAMALAPASLIAHLAPSLGAFAERTTQSLAVTNAGGGPLHVSAQASAAWLQVTPATATVAAGTPATLAVQFDARGLPDGLYVDAVRLGSDDPGRTAVSVPCSLQVGALAVSLDAGLDRVDRAGEGRWVLSGVTLPGGRDPRQLLAPTLRLEGLPIVPARPPEFAGAEGRFAFDRLTLLSGLASGAAVPLHLTGRLDDSTWVAGTAFVRVARPQMIGSPGPVRAAGDPVALVWTAPGGGPVTGYDLWYSSDDGLNWRGVTAGDPNPAWLWTVPSPPTQSGRIELVAIDAGREIGWWISDAFQVTGGTTAVSADRPLEFGLRLCGGNPSASALAVELAVPRRQEARVEVFDVRGRFVRELARGEFAPGRYVLRWDGLDLAGRDAGAGMYFVRARAGTSAAGTRWVRLQ